MPLYHVQYQRLETVIFAVEAADAAEAEERFLVDGEEMGSTLHASEVVGIERVLNPNQEGATP